MDESEQKAYDAVQAEKAELGLVDEPSVEPEKEPTEVVDPTPEKTEEKQDEPAPPKEEEKDIEEKPVSPREYKEIKRTLREELQKDFDQKLESYKQELAKNSPDEEKAVNLEEDIKKLSEELNFDEEKTRKLVEVARKGLEPLTPEEREALKEYTQDKQRRQEEIETKEQEQIFQNEWKEVLPTLQQRFPNATPEQIAKAQEKMEELAFTEKYHETDLDYVLYKEKEAFDKILFSPKQKTFEAGRPTPVNNDDDGEFPEFNPNMSPAQFEAMEKKRERMMENMDRPKVTIRTTNDSGHVVEREE